MEKVEKCLIVAAIITQFFKKQKPWAIFEHTIIFI